ncbi:FxSxx-COOH system tetratricopeptide repeat protein, partial [Actinomadura sp. NPDC000600]|uniref:FxSxx-COOH system tetratricopeptide repeat protein n=1 Tax=Actinomadura sp. NPDC000600 TaxID=3154262 RepID=UPI0033987056
MATAEYEGPQIWGEVPRRNRSFTGRADLLARLSAESGHVTLVVPDEEPSRAVAGGATALHGFGGVGKTQLAVEYAHRHRERFDLVWWIKAEQPALIAAALAALAPRLGLEPVPVPSPTDSVPPGGLVENTARQVLDALNSGNPVSRWLLVYDNAVDPEATLAWTPDGPGQVIITSQNLDWTPDVRSLGVQVFDPSESIEFLSKRMPDVGPEEAERLAAALGHLPILLEHASGWNRATGLSVDEYLDLFNARMGELLLQGTPQKEARINASWFLALSRLTPDAQQIAKLIAHFGPDPISRAILMGGADALDSPLKEILADPMRFNRAIRDLNRFSLLPVNPMDRTFEMHRVLQHWIRETVPPQESRRLTEQVHLLLAEADPKNPDNSALWPSYRHLIPHIGPTRAARSTDPRVRYLMRSIIRYLYESGRAPEAIGLAEECYEHWRAASGPGSLDLLAVRRHLAFALRAFGRFADASALNRTVLEEAEALPEPSDPEERLRLQDEMYRLANSHTIDLRAEGDFEGALSLSEQSVDRHLLAFGPEDPRTLRAQNNLGLDLILSSRYADAGALLEQVYTRMRAREGDGNAMVRIVRNNQIRAIRLSGDFERALFMGEELRSIDERDLGPDHPITLRCAKDLGIAIRLTEGGTAGAVDFAAEILERTCRAQGEHHPDTLAAMLLSANCLREAERLEEALELTRTAYEAYPRVYTDDHPYTHAAGCNLGILLRLTGDAGKALELNKASVDALTAKLGETHHLTLISALGKAAALAAAGRPAARRRPRSKRSRKNSPSSRSMDGNS